MTPNFLIQRLDFVKIINFSYIELRQNEFKESHIESLAGDKHQMKVII